MRLDNSTMTGRRSPKRREMPVATDYLVPGREMTIGSVLSRGFGAIAAAPLLFLGTSFALAAMPSLVARLLLPALVASLPDNPSAVGPLLAGYGGSSIIWLLFYLAAQALLFRATVAHLDDRPEPLAAYAAAAARALPRLFGLALAMTLAVAFGWVLLVVPGVMLAMIWSVAPPALVAERLGVFDALGRSRELTRGARWRILGLVVLVYAIYFVASLVLGLGNGLTASASSGVTRAIVASVVPVILQTVFTAVWTAIQGALYVELRDWKDGPPGNRLSAIFA